MKHIMVSYNQFLVKKIIQTHYMDTDSLILTLIFREIFKNLHNLNETFDFGNFNKNHD